MAVSAAPQNNKTMKNLEVTIYKTSEGKFSLKNESYTTCKKSVMDFLNETDPSTIGKSSRELKNRRYRAGKSSAYMDYIKKHSYIVSCEVAGLASINYDGRLKETTIKLGIISALNEGSKSIKVEPEANKNKPAHKHMLYVQSFNFEAGKLIVLKFKNGFSVEIKNSQFSFDDEINLSVAKNAFFYEGDYYDVKLIPGGSIDGYFQIANNTLNNICDDVKNLELIDEEPNFEII